MQNLWNGPSGEAWVELGDVLDGFLEPFANLLVEAVTKENAKSVLDVGCGAGATTLAIAKTGARCTGVDVSGPLVARARARAEGAEAAAFILADAQTHPFERASYDMIVSRFGVMFFDDPVAAFTNLRRAAKEGAALRLIVWRSAAENPFMTTAERAAAPYLSLPARAPNEPGQFAFGDGDRVRRILGESGWSEVELEPIDVACTMPEDALGPYVARMGPVARALREADEATRTKVTAIVRAAFDAFVSGGEARFTCACFVVSARAR